MASSQQIQDIQDGATVVDRNATFPPRFPKPNDSRMQGYFPFYRLPDELQTMIWKEAARSLCRIRVYRFDLGLTSHALANNRDLKLTDEGVSYRPDLETATLTRERRTLLSICKESRFVTLQELPPALEFPSFTFMNPVAGVVPIIGSIHIDVSEDIFAVNVPNTRWITSPLPVQQVASYSRPELSLEPCGPELEDIQNVGISLNYKDIGRHENLVLEYLRYLTENRPCLQRIVFICPCMAQSQDLFKLFHQVRGYRALRKRSMAWADWSEPMRWKVGPPTTGAPSSISVDYIDWLKHFVAAFRPRGYLYRVAEFEHIPREIETMALFRLVPYSGWFVPYHG
ncbi:hypothetical protein NKR23_g4292 [Pleurostoma richardsiae]|uniref:2EXR domain-containing protein n=1 Tax=Pleurostoma richardsiae TaxID=41990 RepID=A0AA38S237_9PEZI|nr:hypothetical protein NKR23_g4292 [Pleurostoma richardsiae]